MRIPAIPITRFSRNTDGYVYRDGYVGFGNFSGATNPGGVIGIDDASTWIGRDATGNMVFTDINSGEQTLASLIGGGSGSGGSGWIYIADFSGVTVTNEVYQDSGNTVLQSATVSSTTFNVDVRASYPLVEVNGIPGTLTRDGGGGHYTGSVSITVAGAGNVIATIQTPNDIDGATDTAAVAIDLPPTITALSFTGVYPGAPQTELKENDNFSIAITADKDFDRVRVLNFQACKLVEFGVAATSTTTVSATIDDEGDVATLRPARVQVRHATTGAWGSTRDTDFGGGSVDGTDVVNCNNLAPSVSIGSITYPASQSALKDSEGATVVNTLSNFDTVLYDSPNGDLTITNTTTSETPKSVTRLAGNYNISTNNFRIVANRAANDATTIDQDVVNIAHVAATIAVTFPGARIRSGDGTGADTVITITGSQQLYSAPSMSPAASRGTFQGGGFAGSGTTWTRTLRVTDAENPADSSSNSWVTPNATNLAGIVTSSILTGGTYVVGGFESRTLNYAAFTANSTETFPLTTEGNISVGVFSNGNPAVIQPFGTADTTDAGKEGWCAPIAASGTAVSMRMLHIPTVSANSGGLTLTLVEETA